MTEKTIRLSIHGNKVDLEIERDSGNLVLILFGKPEYSLPAWKRLRHLCDVAISKLEERSYWQSTGTHQAVYDKLFKLIPTEGEVLNNKHNKALEKLRKASNCYYDLFNNGLCNRAQEFRSVFGFGGAWIAKQGFPFCPQLESKMDEIVMAAAKEQGVAHG